MTAFNSQLETAQRNALSFPQLNQILDWGSIRAQLSNGIIDLSLSHKNRPFNLLEALLVATSDFPPSAYDPRTNLRNIEASLTRILPMLTENDKKEISHKLSNIGSTSFWDTASELWFAARLKKANLNIKFDFPLQKPSKGLSPPNADVAIIDANDQPIWLLDCTTPTLELEECKNLKLVPSQGAYLSDDHEEAIKCLIAIIKNKFQKKFEPHLLNYPNAHFGIIVLLTKADDISAHFFTLNILKQLPVRTSPKTFHPRLKFAVAGRFQEACNEIQFAQLLLHQPP
ncbi:MAG TPA: hypothetical protein VMF88_10570 [Bacteroidota bacterium]|nr:hypothetical protein [Bacteroidota bacterium]